MFYFAAGLYAIIQFTISSERLHFVQSRYEQIGLLSQKLPDGFFLCSTQFSRDRIENHWS